MKVSPDCALCSSSEKGSSWGSAYDEHSFLLLSLDRDDQRSSILLPSRESYKWKEAFPDLEQGDIICNKCVNKHEHERMYTICDLCSGKYEPIFSDNQGVRCSSIVTETYIIGEYGSHHDEDKFYFTQGRPEYIKLEHNVCDDCIETLVKQGVCLEGCY
ncbi:Hypothetical protein ZAZAV_596 [Cedratvirus Zaza IHUMI]|uniref:Uncharacterized protein n=1 Tax=Cedratvirus Zaza IHUMI TaxID=2126979 RepID=A0A2R8FFY3_9VIRU|nr:Hypothetical protein ZAZAV_596 [Cedratvirus Zaza IHUMI]